MNKKILILMFVLIALSGFASASMKNVIIDEGSYLEGDSFEGVENIDKMLQGMFYEQNSILVKIYYPSKKEVEKRGYNLQPLLQEKFVEFGLNEEGIASLNLIFVYFEDSNGNKKISIGYSEGCGWKGKSLSAAFDIAKSSEGHYQSWTNLIISLYSSIQDQNPNLLKQVCESYSFSESLPVGYKFLFPEKELNRSREQFKRILVMFENYGSLDDGLEEARSHFLEMENEIDFWRTNINSFQIIYAQKMDSVKECVVRGEKLMYCQNEVSSKMNHESGSQNAVIFDNSYFRSYANFGGAIALSTFDISDESDVLAHEFGHSLFCLADEYTESWFFGLEGEVYGKSRPKFPNCASTIEDARMWWGDLDGQEGIGYYEGCAYVDENYRPTETSIMKGDLFVRDYGPINLRHMNRILRGEWSC